MTSTTVSSNPWWISGNNMTLLVNDCHILYCHLDAFRSVTLGCSYFASADYVAVKSWICATFLCPDYIVLTVHFNYHHEKSFPWVVGYSSDGTPHQHNVSILILLNYFVVVTNMVQYSTEGFPKFPYDLS